MIYILLLEHTDDPSEVCGASESLETLLNLYKISNWKTNEDGEWVATNTSFSWWRITKTTVY